jgi:hypothetical protein
LTKVRDVIAGGCSIHPRAIYQETAVYSQIARKTLSYTLVDFCPPPLGQLMSQFIFLYCTYPNCAENTGTATATTTTSISCLAALCFGRQAQGKSGVSVDLLIVSYLLLRVVPAQRFPLLFNSHYIVHLDWLLIVIGHFCLA